MERKGRRSWKYHACCWLFFFKEDIFCFKRHPAALRNIWFFNSAANNPWWKCLRVSCCLAEGQRRAFCCKWPSKWETLPKKYFNNCCFCVVFFYRCSCKRRTSPAATLLATTDAARALQQRGRPQQDHPHRLRAPHAPAPQLRQPLATSAHECNRTESPLHATSVSNR